MGVTAPRAHAPARPPHFQQLTGLETGPRSGTLSLLPNSICQSSQGPAQSQGGDVRPLLGGVAVCELPHTRVHTHAHAEQSYLVREQVSGREC